MGPEARHPWRRIQRLLRAILKTEWSPEAWPCIKPELGTARKERARPEGRGWFDRDFRWGPIAALRDVRRRQSALRVALGVSPRSVRRMRGRFDRYSAPGNRRQRQPSARQGRVYRRAPSPNESRYSRSLSFRSG